MHTAWIFDVHDGGAPEDTATEEIREQFDVAGDVSRCGVWLMTNGQGDTGRATRAVCCDCLSVGVQWRSCGWVLKEAALKASALLQIFPTMVVVVGGCV